MQQGSCYPEGYFNDVPQAKPLKQGYPIAMRPGSTDASVMAQACFNIHRAASLFACRGSLVPLAPVRARLPIDAGNVQTLLLAWNLATGDV